MSTISQYEQRINFALRDMLRSNLALTLLEPFERHVQILMRDFKVAQQNVESIKDTPGFNADTYEYRDLSTRFSELRIRLLRLVEVTDHTRRAVIRLSDQVRHCNDFLGFE